MAYIQNFTNWLSITENSDKETFVDLFLNENKSSTSLTKIDFLERMSGIINEYDDSYMQDVQYAVFESYLLYSTKSHWFNNVSENNRPIIVKTNSHTTLFFNNECFSISNESFDILKNTDLNEDIFSDAWGSVSNFFSDAWEGIKQAGEKVGDWVKEISDSAKAVAGFASIGYMAMSVLQSSDWKSIASTIINISQTLASTYATTFNLDQNKLASTAAIASGLINLYDGRDIFLKGWEKTSGSKPVDTTAFGKSLVESTPDTFLGISKMCMGIKDLSISLKPDLKFENIVNNEEFSSDDTMNKIKEASSSLTKEGEGEGLAKSILNIQNNGNFDSNLIKDSWKSLAICEIAFGLENVYTSNKAEVLDGLSKAKEYIPKAKEFPTIIQNWISTAEKTEFTGGAAIIKDVIQTMGKPMIEAAKNFTSTVLPELINTAEWMGEVSKDYAKANTEIQSNCKPEKSALVIATLPEVKPSKVDVNLKDDDIKALNKNLPSLASQFNVKADSKTNESLNEKCSKVMSFDKWVKLN